MRGNQIVIHVARMAGGVAQATNTRHPRKAPQQCAERRGRAGLVLAVIGIHVLPDQRHFAHARPGEPLDLGRDLLHRPRHFDAARIGHDAEGAELVAAFLHGDEGGNAAAADRLVRGGSQRRRTCPPAEIRYRRSARRAARARSSRAGGDNSASRRPGRRRRGGRFPCLRLAPRSRQWRSASRGPVPPRSPSFRGCGRSRNRPCPTAFSRMLQVFKMTRSASAGSAVSL